MGSKYPTKNPLQQQNYMAHTLLNCKPFYKQNNLQSPPLSLFFRINNIILLTFQNIKINDITNFTNSQGNKVKSYDLFAIKVILLVTLSENNHLNEQ